jgi:hypothetical protein
MLHRGSMLLAIQVLLVAGADGQCRTSASPPNVILLVADDFGWSDLPFYNPPINWKDDNLSPTKQYRHARPDLNRLAARLLAQDSGSLGQFQPAPLLPGQTPPPPYAVIPLDATDLEDHQYVLASDCSDPNGDCASDVLQGFEGLRDLSLGITFSRFYAASAICASTRATIFSGRYPQRTGVNGNGGKLRPDEVTIAELLMQGCNDLDLHPEQPGVQPPPCFGWRDGDSKCCTVDPLGGACPPNELAACYATGLIGKWHLGEEDGRNTPWDQGFREFVGHPRGCCRGHFSRSPLTCSPGPSGQPLYVGAEPGGTCAASANYTSSRDCCDSEDRYYVPGRGDRVTADDPLPCDDDLSARCGDDSPEPLRGVSCLADADCGGGSCWHGGLCLSGASEGQPCNTDVDCADPSCALNCPEGPDCKNGCFYQHKCGCNYGVRAYRDLALNFIRRHCEEPFFLTVAYNATHIGHNAPYRTTRHYRTGNVPSKAKFWGVAEELAASVGHITEHLHDLGLADNTLVFFTADQGRPGGNYGSPTLRGGKGGVFDGGIRIGLLGRLREGSGYGVDDLDGHLGSHVDILPTIAEAAGFSLPGLPTPNVLRACADGGECGVDCPAPSCVPHYVDGRSFYGLLDGAANPDPTPTPGRDLTFATYGGIAVVARPGLVPSPAPGWSVCGYVDENADHVVIRGGSCDSCEDCASARCQILGKVCVGANAGTCVASPDYNGPPVGPTPCTGDRDCVETGSICLHSEPAAGFERCKNGCGGGRACVEIHTDCNTCLNTAWKLKSGPGEGQTPPDCGSTPLAMPETDRLFDLATNPEEQDNLDCKAKFPAVWCDMKRKLINWDRCSFADTCESQNCEGLSNPAECLPP